MGGLSLSVAGHLYVLAAFANLFFVAFPKRWLAWVGRIGLTSGLILHALGMTQLWIWQGSGPEGVSQGLSVLAFLSFAVLAAVDWIYRRPMINAFLNPIVVALFLVALLIPSFRHPIFKVVTLRPALLPIHIALALLGVAIFAVATGVSALYLLMDRQLKDKRFGLFFSRLPSLRFLDALNRHLVVVGFIALSLTLASGIVFAISSGGLLGPWASKEVLTLIAWLVFAALINARFTFGWQGRRAAVTTMAGFILVVACLIISYPLSTLFRGGN